MNDSAQMWCLNWRHHLIACNRSCYELRANKWCYFDSSLTVIADYDHSNRISQTVSYRWILSELHFASIPTQLEDCRWFFLRSLLLVKMYRGGWRERSWRQWTFALASMVHSICLSKAEKTIFWPITYFCFFMLLDIIFVILYYIK